MHVGSCWPGGVKELIRIIQQILTNGKYALWGLGTAYVHPSIRSLLHNELLGMTGTLKSQQRVVEKSVMPGSKPLSLRDAGGRGLEVVPGSIRFMLATTTARA